MSISLFSSFFLLYIESQLAMFLKISFEKHNYSFITLQKKKKRRVDDSNHGLSEPNTGRQQTIRPQSQFYLERKNYIINILESYTRLKSKTYNFRSLPEFIVSKY
jgi:hypothetical protein